MKRKISLITISLVIILSVVALNSISYAAVSISNTAVSMKIGESKSVTLNGSDVTGTVSIKSSNSNVATASGSNWLENNSISISISGKSAGTATITVSGKVADSNTGAETTYSKSISVTVTDKSSSATETTSNTGSSSTTKPEDTNKKSSNANLSNLGIKPNDFSGFKAATTTYNVTVPSDVEEIEVYATAQDSKAKVSGTGKKQLEMGNNTATVTVTAEDGTKKTYTINIARKESEEDAEEKNEETNTEEIQAEGLSELKIGDLKLSPNFETNVYEYAVKYIGEDTKLDIITTATNPEYIVEITGNEDLKEGENIVTILVSDAEGNNVATYQVTVNKSLVDEETLNQVKKEKEEKQKNMIIGAIVAVIILAIIIFLIIRHKRNKNWENEYSIPFSGLNDDENNQLEEFDEDIQYTENDVENKQKLRKEYLENYNAIGNNDEDWQEDKPKKRRHKGKRFK